jgi:hypothetical protein
MTTENENDEQPPSRRGRERRRGPVVLLAFVGVLCAGVLIGWVLFRDDGDTTAPVATSAILDQRARLDVNRHAYPRLGVSLSQPKGWKTTLRRGVLNIASADKRVSVAISDAGGPRDAKKVRGSDRAELARLFKARELGRRRGAVGTSKTIVTEFVGRTPKRQQIRILSMGASSRFRTYSVQVFTALVPSATRLVELSTLIASVRFSKPT